MDKGNDFIDLPSIFLINMLHQLKKKSNRKAMNRNWSNQKANPALKTKAKPDYFENSEAAGNTFYPHSLGKKVNIEGYGCSLI